MTPMLNQTSDHFDGTHFFNPEPTTRRSSGRRKGFLSMLRMRWSKDSDWAQWPRHVPNKHYPAPDGTAPSATFIGHSSFLLRLPGLNVLTDPVFSARCSPSQLVGPKRVRAPGIAISDLPEIGLILLSHNHYDHCDLISLRRIRRRFPAAAIVTLRGNAAWLRKQRLEGAVELDWWQSSAVAGMTITATPARHFAARTLWDRNLTLWGGFFLETPAGEKIYFAGDSGYTRFFS
ncbi:MAG: hypothetical protein B7Z81_01775, partial [Acidocella sp. 20-61-6]